ncbi:ribosome maturation factor RimP [Streptomyces specialis]|uniref:ribosome maturation factor RimP n=1 Tax=Streptomyces specialis TaxID=498367 RepID=UPI00073F0D1C|nr:ribosome maturation factor RimP [Streptomyces specialis]
MSTTQIDRLRELLEPLAGERGMDLEDVRITPAGRRRVLQVVVDADGGVGLDACAELSRAVSERLDETNVMGAAPYVLEVTSPGAERPLTEPRHYRRSVGRLARIRLREGGELTARIVAVDDEGLDLEVPGEKGRRPTVRRAAFAGIAAARVEIEFSRRAAGGDADEEPDEEPNEDPNESPKEA